MTEQEKQAKKELTALRKAATKLGVEFKEETTAEELNALVEAAKVKAAAEKELEKARKAAAKAELAITAEMTADEIYAAIEAAKVAKEAKTSFDVYTRDGGYVRTYSLEDHGEDAEKLANQFAGKIGGSVR
ncbi:MAG: hypothetical protein AB1757_06825 [Acidobacteriota bacterium]